MPHSDPTLFGLLPHPIWTTQTHVFGLWTRKPQSFFLTYPASLLTLQHMYNYYYYIDTDSDTCHVFMGS